MNTVWVITFFHMEHRGTAAPAEVFDGVRVFSSVKKVKDFLVDWRRENCGRHYLAEEVKVDDAHRN